MNGLDFVADLLRRGVVFVVDGERLRVRDPDARTTNGERALISSLKATIRGLLLTELPAERATTPCERFSAAGGIAICRDCGHGYGAHYWLTRDCEFFAGAPSASAQCSRCGVKWLEHVGCGVQPSQLERRRDA